MKHKKNLMGEKPQGPKIRYSRPQNKMSGSEIQRIIEEESVYVDNASKIAPVVFSAVDSALQVNSIYAYP